MLAFDVATVGDNCIDRLQPPVGLSVVGGNAVNLAVHLCRLGLNCGYIGAVGQDADGNLTVETQRARNMVTDHIQRLDSVTAYTEITIYPMGDRAIGFEEFGVCRVYRPSDAEIALLSQMRHVHFGWMVEADELIVRLRSADVTVSKDINVNPGAANLSIAFASQDASDRAQVIAEELLAEGAETAVVTLGAGGSMVTDGRQVLRTGTSRSRLWTPPEPGFCCKRWPGGEGVGWRTIRGGGDDGWTGRHFRGAALRLVDLHAAIGQGMEVGPIANMVNHETNEVFLSGLEIPEENLIGEEGHEFRYILDGLNAERTLIAAECVGDGFLFIGQAVAYANDRVVFDRPMAKTRACSFLWRRATSRCEPPTSCATRPAHYSMPGKLAAPKRT